MDSKGDRVGELLSVYITKQNQQIKNLQKDQIRLKNDINALQKCVVYLIQMLESKTKSGEDTTEYQ